MARRKRVQKVHLFNGVTYRSGYEVEVAKDLYARSVFFDYEPISLEYEKVQRGGRCLTCDSLETCTLHIYTPDFILANGIIIEAKGKWTGAHRTIMKSVMESHPDLDIRMLFQADNWMTSRHVSRYSDWCTRRDMPWAVGLVPQEWTQ